MKIAFCCIGFENLGIEYLTALLRKDGHDVRLFTTRLFLMINSFFQALL